MSEKMGVFVAANVHRDNEVFATGDAVAHEARLARFDRWLRAAREARESAPGPIQRVLDGADLVAATEEDAAAIKSWASRLDGWQDAPDIDKPLLFLPVNATTGGTAASQ